MSIYSLNLNPPEDLLIQTQKQLNRRQFAVRTDPFSDTLRDMRCAGINHGLTNVIFSPEECNIIKDIKGGQRYQGIIFDGETKRYQRIIYQSWQDKYDAPDTPRFLPELVDQFLLYHQETIYYTIKLLYSEAGCQQQEFHTDDRDFALVRSKRKKFMSASYSIIIALEPNDNPTTIVLEGKRDLMTGEKKTPDKVLTILQGQALIMRSDCVHAGGAYDQDNMRLFIATGTLVYKNYGTFVNRYKTPAYYEPDYW